ncbi:TlpA family protein disulfide reductase [Gulosibacter molinativorax]|uniref:TlpA family protein disulfide reductase n=1 Tax=Gulosibacter molinativorax TaxID=256821 RepID=A0ABT7CAS8_9MICO|nr:TlpA disulfide reductase family protein [Gulosibacter molinativorax]MDJ1372308.1 TlpA family protein disulfide reductase [Gulosibacter molinativorax]QUY63402.1 Thiol:disulfide interchange protein [Gulosibacter molinativorax]
MTNRIRRHRRGLTAVALAVVATLALAGCANDSFAEQYAADAEQGYVAGDGSWEVFTPGERAQPVAYEGESESGDTVTSADYAGEVVVMNFWYAACPPCRVEAKDLEQVNQDFADQGVNFLGVNVYDQAPTAESFNKEFGITYPSILDVESASVRLAFSDNVPPQAIPSTLVIDQNGSVAAVIRGVADPSVLTEMINTVLEEQAA